MAHYGRDYGMMDRGNRNFGGSGRTYDMDYNAGYRGLDRDDRFGGGRGGYSMGDRDMNNRSFGNQSFGNRNMGDRDVGFGGGYSGQQMRGGYDRDFGPGQRMTFRAGRHRYDREFRGGHGSQNRDFGDRLRNGWNELKDSARDMMGNDRDRNRNRGYRGY